MERSSDVLARFVPLNRSAAFRALCEKRPKVKFLFKMEVQITLATNKNASFRICERWLFRQFVFHTGSLCRFNVAKTAGVEAASMQHQCRAPNIRFMGRLGVSRCFKVTFYVSRFTT
jgi:hypothetical protein